MFSVIATLLNKFFFFLSIVELTKVLTGGEFSGYIAMLAIGGVTEAVFEPAIEYLAHKAPHKLRWFWGLGLLLVPAAPYSPPFIFGMIWGLYIALGKVAAFKVLPKAGLKGSVLITISGVLCCFDFVFLKNGAWWLVSLMAVISSSFIFFVRVEDGEVDLRELLEVSAKVFTSAFLVKTLWGLVIVQVPTLLVMEKGLKALAGIAAAVLKLTASVESKDLRRVKVLAILIAAATIYSNWMVIFLLAFTYRKAQLERALEFKKLANRRLLKNACEAILLGVLLAFSQGNEDAVVIFLIYQAFNLIILIP